MLVQIQKTEACPGNWYNGLQLCDHINGSYPAADGTLERWQKMVEDLKPMRLMWWTNPTYWSVQGQVWSQAVADKSSDVGRWFSWGPEDCDGLPPCASSKGGRNVVVDGVGCAQGSWGSEGMDKGALSALASFGSSSYADYMVDAMANSWTRNLGIDGYTEDCSAIYPCMLQTGGRGGLKAWADIVRRVRKLQPQVVMSGEWYGSWSQVIEAEAQMGGQGFESYHDTMQAAVLNGDASDLEGVASKSGADAATVLCYLHAAFDGRQPGACPTMYFRDQTKTLHDPKQHLLWVALEAGSGIVSQHDFDPSADGGAGAWWNVTNDPIDASVAESPLRAFGTHRALNRLALRTKLDITQASSVMARAAAAPHDGGRRAPPKEAGGALAYLKHDALGPMGDACLMLFNPGAAQTITVDLSSLPAAWLDGSVVPHDLLDADGAAGPPLAPSWSVEMSAGQVKALGGFTLASFAPRAGKKGTCTAPGAGSTRRATGSTLQACFLECLGDAQCDNVLVDYVDIVWMETPPPVNCTLLGPLDPVTDCKAGTGTLVKKLTAGRPH